MPKLIFQHNPQLKPDIQRTGCNLTVIATMMQLKSRYLLDPSELNYLYEQAVSKGYCTTQCSMNNPQAFLKMCFDYVGARNVRVAWDWSRVRIRAWDPRRYDFTVIDWRTGSVSYGGHHFCLGNSKGDMIYDPDNPRSKRYIKGFNNWRLWVATCDPLTDKEIRKLKNERGLEVRMVDYIPGIEYGLPGNEKATPGKIVEKVIDPVPDTPTEMVITNDGIEVSGGLIEYLNSMGGTLNLEM